MDEILREFLAETIEALGELGEGLARLAADPADRAAPAAAFRCIHTLKGNAGLLGFDRLERLAHEGESVLAACRDHGRAPAPDERAELDRVLADLRAEVSRVASARPAETGPGAGASAGPGERLHPEEPGSAAGSGAVARSLAHLPRLVAELARRRGRCATLQLEGGDVAMDPALLARLRGPITHLVRNAIAHGVEPPAERAAAGKPAAGRLVLRARMEGDGVCVEIQDDGAGIDPARIRQRARDAGVLGPGGAPDLPDEDALRLILRPGLSTADAVDSLAGRGVGLDAVRAEVEAIGGRVEVRSRPGAGTTVSLHLPAETRNPPSGAIGRKGPIP